MIPSFSFLRKSIILLLSISLLVSCNFYHSKLVTKVVLDKNNRYEIKKQPMDAGCRLLFYNRIKDNRIIEQFSIEYVCRLFEPTKYIFSYDSTGKINAYKQLVAVVDSSYTIELSEIDKAAFIQFENLTSGWASKKVDTRNIKGFKEIPKTAMRLIPVEIKLPE